MAEAPRCLASVNGPPLTRARRAAGPLLDWAIEVALAGILYNVAESPLLVVVALGFSPLWEAVWLRLFGATPGHLVLGMRVRGANGAYPSLVQGLRRSLRRPGLVLAYLSSGPAMGDRRLRRVDEDLALTTTATARTRGARAALGIALLLVAAGWIASGTVNGSSPAIPPDGAWWTAGILLVLAGAVALLDPIGEPDVVMGTIVPPVRPMLDEIVAEAPPQLPSTE